MLIVTGAKEETSSFAKGGLSQSTATTQGNGEATSYEVEVIGSGMIPNIEGKYQILLAVRGPEVERLEKGVRRLYEELIILEELPECFWLKLGTLTGERRFRVCMVTELYLATQKACLLQQELRADEDPRCHEKGEQGSQARADPKGRP